MARLLTQDICDRAELLSRAHPRRTVAELTGLPESTLWALKKRKWRAVSHFRPLRPMPTDFAILNRHYSMTEMAEHYQTSFRTITRWRKELRA